jgi:hypothetical protein
VSSSLLILTPLPPTPPLQPLSPTECLTKGDSGFEEAPYYNDGLGCNVAESSCVCRAAGDTCYKDFKALYDLFLIVLFCIFLYEFVYAFRCSYVATIQRFERKRVNSKTGHFTPLDKILILTTISNFIRCLWIISIIPGRHADDMLFGPIGDAVLLKAPQILWQSGFLYLALVWKQLLDQMESMKKNNREADKAMERKVNLITVVFSLVCIPLSFLGVSVSGLFTMILNLIQLFSGVVLIYKAKVFGHTLADKMKKIAKAEILVMTIKKTINWAIAASTILFFAVLFNFYGQANLGRWWMFSLWMLVHGPEVMLCHALMLTKRAQNNKQIAEAKFRTTTKSRAGTDTFVSQSGVDNSGDQRL